ncbi:MAG: YlmC/YmxH family sporulation protein [Lachnospiraceae bacterium]|nr:YlmC/YmxH family sporulation protein [Lachnospiraceae bacterium]MDD3615995.1 YlmC/YmxH family sporulation protein [Lachnospiraceae bacterium]
MKCSELKQKDVINICSCRTLGVVADLEFDCCTGCVLSLIVPGPSRICNLLGRDGDYVIPWSCVKQIGEDIVLVEIMEEKFFHKI